jgi:phosphatidylserine/phosphatidylglycerophosphate/cardiolipin synthase-like enzyme
MPLNDLEALYFPPVGKDAAAFSRASTFEPLIDGDAYFAAVRAAIDTLSDHRDACYIAGWSLSDGFKFEDGIELGYLLAAKAAAGVDVRVIVWANSMVLDVIKQLGDTYVGELLATKTPAGPFAEIVYQNVKAAERLRLYGNSELAGRVLLDWSGNRLSSHHMKFTVVAHGDDLVGFIGVDYRQDRMGTPMHRGEPRTHEVGVRVTGAAAASTLATFETRWTEAATLSEATYKIGKTEPERQYNPPPLAEGNLPFPFPVQASVDTSVQVVRSFPDSKEYKPWTSNTRWASLPEDGVHEIRSTFRRALEAARRYIYIEDQAFDAIESLFPWLVGACERGVKVIALIPGRGDPAEGGQAVPRELSPEVQKGIVDKLSDTDRTNLAVWQLAGIFVHSKVILIDDEFASIGSANCMDRSMQSTSMGDDSELSVAAVSTGTLVSDLRVALWAEHLRVSARKALAQIRDLDCSLEFWRPGWGTGAGFTFPHKNTQLVSVGP